MAVRQDAARRATATTWPSTSTRRSPRRARSSRRSIPAARARAGLRGVAAGGRRAVPGRAVRSRSPIHVGADDSALADTLLLRVAQELVVNAVKHAAPDRGSTCGRRCGGRPSSCWRSTTTGSGSTPSRRGRAVQAGHVGLAMVRRRVEDRRTWHRDPPVVRFFRSFHPARTGKHALAWSCRSAVLRGFSKNSLGPGAKHPGPIGWTHVLLRPGRAGPNLQIRPRKLTTPKAAAAA